jgi:hypothetical protein
MVERDYRVRLQANHPSFSRSAIRAEDVRRPECPAVVNLVQSELNKSLSTRLNKRTPMQVFTGHEETTHLALMLKDNVPVKSLNREDNLCLA